MPRIKYLNMQIEIKRFNDRKNIHPNSSLNNARYTILHHIKGCAFLIYDKMDLSYLFSFNKNGPPFLKWL